MGLALGLGLRLGLGLGSGLSLVLVLVLELGSGLGLRASGAERCACRGSSWAGGGSGPLAAFAALAAWQGECYFLVL